MTPSSCKHEHAHEHAMNTEMRRPHMYYPMPMPKAIMAANLHPGQMRYNYQEAGLTNQQTQQDMQEYEQQEYEEH